MAAKEGRVQPPATLEIEMLLGSQAFPELLSDLKKLTLDSSLSSVTTLRPPGTIIGE